MNKIYTALFIIVICLGIYFWSPFMYWIGMRTPKIIIDPELQLDLELINQNKMGRNDMRFTYRITDANMGILYFIAKEKDSTVTEVGQVVAPAFQPNEKLRGIINLYDRSSVWEVTITDHMPFPGFTPRGEWTGEDLNDEHLYSFYFSPICNAKVDIYIDGDSPEALKGNTQAFYSIDFASEPKQMDIVLRSTQTDTTLGCFQCALWHSGDSLMSLVFTQDLAKLLSNINKINDSYIQDGNFRNYTKIVLRRRLTADRNRRLLSAMLYHANNREDTISTYERYFSKTPNDYIIRGNYAYQQLLWGDTSSFKINTRLAYKNIDTESAENQFIVINYGHACLMNGTDPLPYYKKALRKADEGRIKRALAQDFRDINNILPEAEYNFSALADSLNVDLLIDEN